MGSKATKRGSGARAVVSPTPAPVTGPQVSERGSWVTANRVILPLIAVAVLLFYHTPLFDSNSSIQWDAVDVHYSSQKYFSDMLWTGKLSFWTPYVFSGMPFLADPQVGAWYPLNWPFFLAGITPGALEWELALHCFLACAGTFLLARDLLKSVPAALVASACYGMSGFFAGHSSHLGMFQTAALFPWLIFTAHRAMNTRRPEWLLGTGMVAGTLVLAGHFQTGLYCFTGLALFLIVEIVLDRAKLAWGATIFGGTIVLAVLLAAIQVFPGVELAAQSIRSTANYSRETNAPLVLGALATLVSPNHYGAVHGVYKGPQDITQFYFYGGLLLLPFAALGAIRSCIRWYGVILILPCLWYAFGPAAGLYRAVAQLPAFQSVRAPVHIWFVIAFGLALLAGAGCAELKNWIRPGWIPVAILLFFCVDVWHWNMDQNTLAYARSSFEELYRANYERYQSAIAPLRTQPLYRIWAPSALAAFGPMNSSLESKTEATYGYNPLELARYADYLDAANSNPKLLDGLSVTAKVEPAKGQITVEPGSLPRGFFPPEILRAASPADAKAKLQSLDPGRQVLVENAPASVHQDARASAQIRSYEGSLYRIHYTAATESVLRIAVPYFPGWRASIERGSRLTVLPADLALTGIVVPTGTHDLTLKYESTWFLAGAVSTLLSGLVACGALILKRRLWGRLAPKPGGKKNILLG